MLVRATGVSVTIKLPLIRGDLRPSTVSGRSAGEPMPSFVDVSQQGKVAVGQSDPFSAG